MTEDNQNNEFKPQPLPGQVFIRPGIDDRPDYEKTLTPEAKAAMRRLSVQQHPRIPEASNERPETQAARIASEGGAPQPRPRILTWLCRTSNRPSSTCATR